MDYSQKEAICNLYDRELELMDLYSDDLNNDKKYQDMVLCHERRLQLQGDADLAAVYESVRGLNNPITIDLYFEKAQEYEADCERMIPIYQHVLNGCIDLWGETGEKTIECKLQIVVCLKGLLEKLDENGIEEEFVSRSKTLHSQILDILEEIIESPHDNTLYDSFIPLLLSDEYISSGNISRAHKVFEEWSLTHPITQIKDVEEMKCWIEYTRILSEIGLLQVAIDKADTLYKIVEENQEKYADNLPGIIRSLSEIYVACTLYHKAAEIIEKTIKRREALEDRDDLLLLSTQLAHCYSLDGERIKAANLIVELRKRMDETKLPVSFKLQFDNIQGAIEGALGDHEQHYQRMLNAFKDSRRQYGENDENTVLYENNLGEVCFDLYNAMIGDVDDYLQQAEYYLRDALDHSEFSRGKDNLFSLLIRRNLAEVIAAKGDFENAIKMMKEVWEITSKALTENNDETVSAKIRYAALILELQQLMDDVPDWIDEIDTEPLLKDGFQKKAENLGMKHWETLDALYWYNRAVQSRELTQYITDIQKGKLKDSYFTESLKLHKLLFKNVSDMVMQAYYINSVAKQNNYMELLELNMSQVFWLISNMGDSYDIGEIFELVEGYKNISFDMQYHKYASVDSLSRKTLVEDTTTVSEATMRSIFDSAYGRGLTPREKSYIQCISGKVKDTNDVYLDLWQEAQCWFAFIIDKDGIYFKQIDYLSDDEIPPIDAVNIEPQAQLDDLTYDREGLIDAAIKLAEQLKNILMGYHRVYYNLQKQLLNMPIGNYIYIYTGIPAVQVPSIDHFIESEREKKRDAVDITFIEDDCSIDYLLVRECVPDHIQTADINHIPSNSNAICVSGHGFYDHNTEQLEGKRNYITLNNGNSIFMTDIIRKDMRTIDLAILPICQSGIGEIYSNFGSYSIGKAFIIAGVRYTVETLWNIAYNASIIFEYEFFRKYCEEADIIKAYYHALDRLRRYTREDLKEMCRIVLRTTGDSDIARMLYADLANGQHPYEKEEYWAGFILAGR